MAHISDTGTAGEALRIAPGACSWSRKEVSRHAGLAIGGRGAGFAGPGAERGQAVLQEVGAFTHGQLELAVEDPVDEQVAAVAGVALVCR